MLRDLVVSCNVIVQVCVNCGGFGQIALPCLLPPVNLCESLQLCWQTTQDDAIRHEQLDVVQLLVKYRGRPSSDEELQTLPCFAPLCVCCCCLGWEEFVCQKRLRCLCLAGVLGTNTLLGEMSLKVSFCCKMG